MKNLTSEENHYFLFSKGELIENLKDPYLAPIAFYILTQTGIQIYKESLPSHTQDSLFKKIASNVINNILLIKSIFVQGPIFICFFTCNKYYIL